MKLYVFTIINFFKYGWVTRTLTHLIMGYKNYINKYETVLDKILIRTDEGK